jgi:hypothetical protein
MESAFTKVTPDSARDGCDTQRATFCVACDTTVTDEVYKYI